MDKAVSTKRVAVPQDKSLMLRGVGKFPDRSSPLRRNIAWFPAENHPDASTHRSMIVISP